MLPDLKLTVVNEGNEKPGLIAKILGGSKKPEVKAPPEYLLGMPDEDLYPMPKIAKKPTKPLTGTSSHHDKTPVSST